MQEEISKVLGSLESRLREQADMNGNTTCRPVTCEKCGGTGWVYTDQWNEVKPCACVAVQRERKRLEASGLQQAVEAMTFAAWQSKTPWQQKAADTARAWKEAILRHQRPWLFYGGAVGSGKTHLCTAACGEVLNAGIAVRYMLWPEESRRLKAAVMDAADFDRLIQPFKTVPVLYIDDLFKTKRNDQRAIAEAVTPTDVRVAFEIIDARVRTNRPTVISTEWMLDELVEADEGTFSRVNIMSAGYQVQIAREKDRNWRMKGATA